LVTTKFVGNSDGVYWLARSIERTDGVKNMTVGWLVELVGVNSTFNSNAHCFAREQHCAKQ
jgi:hypothetical protein